MLTFGPIPSRRLGRSLGINNTLPKVCSYSCVYCQVGRTTKLQVERQAFYTQEEILQDIDSKIEKTRKAGAAIDFLTFVPDGEPTLDINLGREIDLLKSFGIKVALISNASLIWRAEVREDLMKADWVSLKLDAVYEAVWHKIDRPHRSLQLAMILDGMLQFATDYQGELATETMLVEGLNDSPEHAEEIANFLSQLKPDKAYISIPTRPPAEPWVQSPPEALINQTYQILSHKIDSVEYLIAYEGNDFACTGSIKEDILSITAVHPMREDALQEYLQKTNFGWSAIQELIDQNCLIEIEYNGRKFYMRKFSYEKAM